MFVKELQSSLFGISNPDTQKIMLKSYAKYTERTQTPFRQEAIQEGKELKRVTIAVPFLELPAILKNRATCMFSRTHCVNVNTFNFSLWRTFTLNFKTF